MSKIIMFFKRIASYMASIILSMLAIVLINQDYMIAIYTIITILGVLPFFVGQSNALYYMRQGFGITRGNAFRRYVDSMVKIVILSIIFLAFISLFSSLVYRNIGGKLTSISLKVIVLYLYSLVLSGFGLFICNLGCKNNENKYIIGLMVVLFLTIVCLFIYLLLYVNSYYVIIVSLLLLIGVNILNMLSFRMLRFN